MDLENDLVMFSLSDGDESNISDESDVKISMIMAKVMIRIMLATNISE